MTSLLHRIGGAAAANPWRTLAAWLVAAGCVLALAAGIGGQLVDDYTLPGKDSQRATDLLRERFPERSGTTARVVLHAPDGAATAVSTAVVDDVRDRLQALPHVSLVEPAQVSSDARTAVLSVQYDVPVTDVDPPAANDGLVAAAAPARAAGLQTELGGEVPDQIQAGGSSEVVGIAVAAVILVLAFGSVLAAGLPLVIALAGLGVGMGLVTLLAATARVSTITPTVAAMIGLGVGIDYALFIVDRHRQHLLAGETPVQAAAAAVSTAGRSVVVAGGTVLIALCGLVASGLPNFMLMGLATGLVVAVSVAAAVTLLPALLGLAGQRVLGRRARRALSARSAAPAAAPATARRPSLAARWADQAVRHPWRYAAASLVLLLALAAPVLDMRLGQSDASSESTSTTTRRAYDIVDAAFGPGANGPLVVVEDLRASGAPGPASLREQLAALDGVVAVSPAVLDRAGDTAVLTVVPASGPQDLATERLVERVRAELSTSASVTGATASFIDFNALVQEHLVRVIVVVVAASFLLLVLLLRSVVAPLKAAAMNLLSVGAAYGAVTALFQWGWGASFLGLEHAVPVNAFVPLFMFAILFGLSMDYEVFLLGRIREEWQRTGDPRSSVVAGLSSTARVISSAAVIMVAVFAGFAMDDSVAVKMIGTGLAVAVLVDATIVRLVLVPATMTLLGSATWWFPRLRRRPHASALPAVVRPHLIEEQS